MKGILVCLIGFIRCFSLNAQVDAARMYDFWLGKWEVSWDEGKGKLGKGINIIERDLKGGIIRENFKILEGQSKGFEGTSISTFNPVLKQWRQAWADSQGGYFDFTGGVDENQNPIFMTVPTQRGEQIAISRMVFKSISKDSLIWDWEASRDGGQTWKLNWRIKYKKMKSGKEAFDPLLGTCFCESYRTQADGTWGKPVGLTWQFKKIMNGKGVQDEFFLDDGTSGGSIRQFDEKSGKWYVHYYSSATASPQLQAWEGEKNSHGDIVLYSPQKSPSGADGFLKLKFYDINKAGYRWIGEWVNEDETVASPFWKIECKKGE